MIAYLLLQLVSLIVGIALIVRVWRASALQAILCMIIPGYVLVPMIKYWNDPDHNIRWHVALLFTCAGTMVWMQYRMVREYQAEQARLLAESAEMDADDDADDPDSVETDAHGDQSAASAEVEIGSAAILSGHRPPARASTPPVRQAAAPAHAEVATAPAVTALAPARRADAVAEAPMTLARASAEAPMFRGKYERASMGLTLGLADHFRALSSVDARRIESALGLPADEREIAWVLHEDVPLAGASSWHVRVRWLDDGWVAPGVARDPERLLRLAQRGPAAKRLAGSGGDLLGYAVAPTFETGVADWVEERLPAGADSSVLDCHAVRLGRKGVLEFSVVGAPAGSQALCDASVRLLARHAVIDNGAEYPLRAPADSAAAPYTFEDLITQR